MCISTSFPGLLPAQDTTVPSRTTEAIEQRREEVRAQLEEPGLSGDWFGFGKTLVEHGIHFEAAATFFGQDAWAGDGDSTAVFGGKIDGLLRLDLDKLGLWDGLSLTAHPEYNFGETANGFGGTILPANVAMQLPGATNGERFDISSVFLTQRFSDRFTLIVGKTNLADIAALHPYSGGAGLTAFMNGGLAAAPTGANPPYTYGGVLLAKTDAAVFSLALYGGTSAQGSLNFAEAFDDGYLLSAGVAIPVRPGNRPGKQSLSILWGDRDAGSLRDLLPPEGGATLDRVDSRRYLLTYSFHQELGNWSGDDKRGWGVWGRANFSDNELTAVAWSVAGGVGGDSPLPNRHQDRWGLGFFYFGLADFLKDPAITPIRLGDERGIELFYSAALTPWLRLSADLQIIDPAVAANDSVVLFGLRSTVRF